MSEHTKTDYSWCKRIFAKLEPPANVSSIEPGIEINNEPEWVQNVFGELVQQAMPLFSLRKPKENLARELGLLLSQQCANLYVRKELEPQLKLPTTKFFCENQNVPGVMSTLKASQWLNRSLAVDQMYSPVFWKAINEAFRAALQQPSYEQAADFFRGFAKGISKPGISKAGLAGRTTATLIYEKLYVHRREVEQLQNYPALREFLIKNGVLPKVVGSVRRIQKLCERVGLHLAKRGRPRISAKLRQVS